MADDDGPLVGVLAIQGSVEEHVAVLAGLGARAREIRTPDGVAGIDGLVLPGGESTAMGIMTEGDGLWETIRAAVDGGLPVSSFEVPLAATGGASAEDAALVAKDYPAVFIRAPAILKVGKKCEALASVTVAPHASAAPAVKAFDGPAKPPKKKAKKQAAAEAAIPEREVVVAARQGNILVTAFHPELTDDTRWHDLFLAMVKKRTSG
ncbi:pyridoxal 5'-phosphate synthase [Aureococcus anophagefferens]|nr:pyridoxal 5'-phosphate synthase [Aureococcus anophagefferens]